MGTRRAFLQAGVAMTLTTAAHAGSALIESSVLQSMPAIAFYRVVVDGRYEESVAFAGEAQRLGSTVRTTDGDVTRLWYEELQPRWRQAPAAIAGLTAHGPLFCLERWAWDHGMRVVFRADHQRKFDGRTRHFVACADRSELLRRQLTAAGTAYPIEAARAAHRCSRSSYQVVSPAGVACGPRDCEPLVSWVIAPIDRT